MRDSGDPEPAAPSPDDGGADIDVIVRPEQPSDMEAIGELTARAFAGLAWSDGTEPAIIGRLRDEGALALSLLADLDGRVVGHVAFSRAQAADGSGGWFALGPVCVEPALQRRGIGTRLISTGIAQLIARDASGCVVVGDTRYYRRFGFEAVPDLAPPGYPAGHFMILPLAVRQPDTVVDFHPAFRAPGAYE